MLRPRARHPTNHTKKSVGPNPLPPTGSNARRSAFTMRNSARNRVARLQAAAEAARAEALAAKEAARAAEAAARAAEVAAAKAAAEAKEREHLAKAREEAIKIWGVVPLLGPTISPTSFFKEGGSRSRRRPHRARSCSGD